MNVKTSRITFVGWNWWTFLNCKSLQAWRKRIKVHLRTQIMKNQVKSNGNNFESTSHDLRNTHVTLINKTKRFSLRNNEKSSISNRWAAIKMWSWSIWRTFGHTSIIKAEQWVNSRLDGLIWARWWRSWWRILETWEWNCRRRACRCSSQ